MEHTFANRKEEDIIFQNKSITQFNETRYVIKVESHPKRNRLLEAILNPHTHITLIIMIINLLSLENCPSMFINLQAFSLALSLLKTLFH